MLLIAFQPKLFQVFRAERNPVTRVRISPGLSLSLPCKESLGKETVCLWQTGVRRAHIKALVALLFFFSLGNLHFLFFFEKEKKGESPVV